MTRARHRSGRHRTSSPGHRCSTPPGPSARGRSAGRRGRAGTPRRPATIPIGATEARTIATTWCGVIPIVLKDRRLAYSLAGLEEDRVEHAPERRSRPGRARGSTMTPSKRRNVSSRRDSVHDLDWHAAADRLAERPSDMRAGRRRPAAGPPTRRLRPPDRSAAASANVPRRTRSSWFSRGLVEDLADESDGDRLLAARRP